MSNLNKTIYISQLPTKVQVAIKKELKAGGIKGELLNDAMNGRLCDLEDTINIHPYLK